MRDLDLSILRSAEHKALSGLTIDGVVLDIGGNQKSKYHKLIGGDHKIIFANIEPRTEPDLLFDAQRPWPVEPESFDAVLMFNLLEHVFDYRAVLASTYTALRPGGRLIGAVPFMFNVHGDPSDYFRYTRHALEILLPEAGLRPLRISELGSGAFSVAWHCVQGPMPGFVKSVGAAAAAGLDRFLSWLKPGNKLSADYFPLGYHFEAERPRA